MSTRSRRLADFQQGRAPELAALTASRAPVARSAMLERQRQEAGARESRIRAGEAQARTDALVGNVVAVLAGAMSTPARLDASAGSSQAGSGAVQASTDDLLAETVAVLAGAFGPAKCPVCRCCKRAISRDRRTCRHCGAKDAVARPVPGQVAA